MYLYTYIYVHIHTYIHTYIYIYICVRTIPPPTDYSKARSRAGVREPATKHTIRVAACAFDGAARTRCHDTATTSTQVWGLSDCQNNDTAKHPSSTLSRQVAQASAIV